MAVTICVVAIVVYTFITRRRKHRFELEESSPAKPHEYFVNHSRYVKVASYSKNVN